MVHWGCRQAPVADRKRTTTSEHRFRSRDSAGGPGRSTPAFGIRRTAASVRRPVGPAPERAWGGTDRVAQGCAGRARVPLAGAGGGTGDPDRKSTRLNSSHLVISYAVFCLKKKKEQREPQDGQ